MRYALIVMLVGVCVGLSGCAWLSPTVEKAEEVAAARQAEFDAAVTSYTKAADELKDIVAKYEAAVASGETSKAQALAEAMSKAAAKYESAKEVAQASKGLYEAAVTDFKNAKSSSDYVGTILGWVVGGLGSLFGGGALFGRAKAREALTGTTAALERVKAVPEAKAAWGDAKSTLLSTLSTGALKLIDHVRP